MKKRNVLIFCAHPDDEAIGPGGTIKKYASEGIDVQIIVFSGGDKSHLMYKKDKLILLRKKESEAAGRVLGAKSVQNLLLPDMKLMEEIKKRKIKRKIETLIKKYDPEKIFTHAIDDLIYSDHRAVHDSVVEAVNKIASEENKKYPVYTFNIWSINVRKRDEPKLIVDISKQFKYKLKALNCFKSQWLALLQLTPFVYLKAIFSGWKNDVKYAEEFYKIL